MTKRFGYVLRNTETNEFVRDQYKDIVVFKTIEDATSLVGIQKLDTSKYTIERLVKWHKPRGKRKETKS